jgi:thiol:disulfide interchange protein DsbD
MNPMTRFLTLLLWLALSLTAIPASAQEDELLPPEQAFSLSARMDGDRLIAEYRIAPGYYMYRKQFAFESETDGVTLGEADIPPGHKKKDEFFGEVETYRDRVRITVPVDFGGNPPQTLRIKARGQGCADIGVCYPPLFQTLKLQPGSNATVRAERYVRPADIKQLAAATEDNSSPPADPLQALLTLPAAADKPAAAPPAEPQAAPPSSDALSLLQSFGDEIGLDDEEEIPSPDQAYRISATLADDNTIQADILIRDKTYLYKDKFGAGLAAGSGVTVNPPVLPKGDIKDDEFFGRMEVYHNSVQFPIRLDRSDNASREFAVALNYQGCVEDKICYPPMTKFLKVNLDKGSVDILDEKPEIAGAPAAGGDTAGNGDAPPAAAPTDGQQTATLGQSEQDRFNSILSQGSLWLIVFSFFIAGILLTFTPCVFPMIPILSGIIAGQGEHITTRKAFVLSLVYVLAMAVTYAIAGAIVGYFGAEFNIQAWFQDPLILSLFAGLFVLLALSMFGFYELQMPAFIQSRVTEISNRQHGGELAGVGIMGSLSALIVGPCITAPLVGALIFISQTQDWLTGGLALFALGLGMGVPLLVVGTAGGKFLPKAGTWMDAVKAVFGVGLLAIAIWMLERILPTEITMLLMALLIIVSAIYMGAIQPLPEGASGWRKLWKGLGFVLLVYGVFYLYGVAAGSKDLIQPLKGLNKATVIRSVSGGSATGKPLADHVIFQQIKGRQGLEKALAEARANRQPVMLDFYADWCISCKEMEKYAFTHPDVLRALDGFMTIQADVTPNDATDKALMKSLGIFGPPAILFFDRDGKEIPGSRVVGAMSGKEFAEHIIKWTGDL